MVRVSDFVFTSQMKVSQLADLLGIDESLVKNIMISDTSNLSGKTMSIGEFLGYMVNQAMSYEMSKIFDSELTLITLLTAAIFIIVALTFKNLALPAILVLIMQCGVYIAVSVVGIQGMKLYYLALLMVECILMGSTIDYGILFTTYYLDCRETMDIQR